MAAAIPIEATISQVAVGGQTLYTAIVRDITERQHLETEREARHEKDRWIAESLQRSLLLAPPEEQFAGLSVATVYEAAWDEASVGGDFFDLWRARPPSVLSGRPGGLFSRRRGSLPEAHSAMMSASCSPAVSSSSPEPPSAAGPGFLVENRYSYRVVAPAGVSPAANRWA